MENASALAEIRRDPDYRRYVISIRIFFGAWLFLLVDVVGFWYLAGSRFESRVGLVLSVAAWCTAMVVWVRALVVMARLRRRYELGTRTTRYRAVAVAALGDAMRFRDPR